MNKKFIKVLFLVLIILLVVVSIYNFKGDPNDILSKIKTGNFYYIIFFAGFLGGVSILFPFPYYIFVVLFASLGTNPFILGAVAALGVMIGETTSFFLGYTGGEIIKSKYIDKISKIVFRLNDKHPKRIPVFLFLWGSFLPIPNDFLLIPLGAIKYPYWKTIVSLGLGNLVYGILLACSGYYGFRFWFN